MANPREFSFKKIIKKPGINSWEKIKNKIIKKYMVTLNELKSATIINHQNLLKRLI